ncbi:SufS family cysteine desulfurase [Candidatus Riesia pediculicola]|uniref:Cysteine desulfurase n=1 Tax=Riesia pediculicola (strain USDA) TaxID=515618 RepID=D4G7U4_RIEPU|nr:SufS family cysteine desulfurase [Candidatus Riesia pediculicola]ADD79407.1 aminotransferase, class-V [Candidatus Riesia pediculicola USDA]ARC53662.1 cysteine sulfinate desulfinase [Candidatus Riesia pediculicola]QOJ86310.1 SufS family cysteine desulfurase [Candidatus Riesia pediculicola]
MHTSIIDSDLIRKQFPILSRRINGFPLIYLDNAASSQKPIQVRKKEEHFLDYFYSSIHRGSNILSDQSTEQVESVRYQISKFINASDRSEIVFTKNTTESINLVAYSYVKKFVHSGDNIIISQMEHHSNIVPWYILSNQVGFEIRILPINKEGEIDLKNLKKMIDSKTKFLSVTHMSNVLGTINPVRKIIECAKKFSDMKNSKLHVLIDGAQYISHYPVDVQRIDCDFYVFSGHKMYGPTGIGILYGKKKILNQLDPWQSGGGMVKEMDISYTSFDQKHKIKSITYEKSPWKFESGTINVVGIIGLGEALKYISEIGYENISRYEEDLIRYTYYKLKEIRSIRLYGTLKKRKSIISFNIGRCHSYDIGRFLDLYSISIRTGHHCAIPLMNFYGVSSMCRISLAIYNQKKEIDFLVEKLKYVEKLLSRE